MASQHSTPLPAVPERRTGRLVAALGLVAVVLTVGLSAARAEERVHPGPPTLAGAREHLADAEAALADAQARRRDLRQELIATRMEIDGLGLEQVALARELELARARVRLVTVRAYTGGGDRALELAFDAGDLGDHLYRNELLTGSAVDTRQAIADYEDLRDRADSLVVELAEAADDLESAIATAAQDVTRAEEAIARANVELSAAQAWTSYNAGGRTDPGEAAWSRLRFCESGGVYAINTGNGFYGAYQFDLQTWQSMGGSGLPSDAPYWEQDLRAKALFQARGAQPWPLCGRFLG